MEWNIFIGGNIFTRLKTLGVIDKDLIVVRVYLSDKTIMAVLAYSCPDPYCSTKAKTIST